MDHYSFTLINHDSGNFCVDDAILREEGMTNFDQYAAVPGTKFEDLMPYFFLDDFLEENQKTIGK